MTTALTEESLSVRLANVEIANDFAFSTADFGAAQHYAPPTWVARKSCARAACCCATSRCSSSAPPTIWATR